MQINKLEYLIYSFGRRLQGYKLLKNPKDTSSGYVRMIKHFKYMDNNCDIFDYYERITKDFSKKTKQETVEHLFTRKCLFFRDNKPKYNRESTYSFFDLPTHKNSREAYKKCDISERDLLPLDKIVKNKTILTPNMMTAFLGFPLPMEETKMYTLRDVLVNRFYKNLYNTNAERRSKSSNFFTILWKNLFK